MFGEDNETISEVEFLITSTITEDLTQCEMDNNNLQWNLENRKQNIEMQKSGGNFRKKIQWEERSLKLAN